MNHACGVNERPRILAHDDPDDLQLSGRLVDLDVGHPSRPGGRGSRKFAVHIDGVVKSAAPNHVFPPAFLGWTGMRPPSGAFRNVFDASDSPPLWPSPH